MSNSDNNRKISPLGIFIIIALVILSVVFIVNNTHLNQTVDNLQNTISSQQSRITSLENAQTYASSETQQAIPSIRISEDSPVPITTVAPRVQNSNASDRSDIIVYITKTGEKYHSSGCQYLSQSKIPITLEEAKALGYTPCSRCNPPE